MKYIVTDVEATCWEKKTTVINQEIIEIGAVKLDGSLSSIDEFQQFVRPVDNPLLSNFCRELTSITQEQVAQAEPFSVVFPNFIEWIGPDSCQFVTWGDYDVKQIQVECRRHSIKLPQRFVKKHINLKPMFAKRRGIRPCGMAQALQMVNFPLEGTHHRGIDDARNISRIARTLLS